MTATDVLRSLLDERGVHWWAGEDERKTLWESNGLTWEYFNDENGDAWLGFLGACEQDVTPEQAIAATLGSSNCTDDERTNGTCHIEERHRDWYCTGCGEMVGTCDAASELFIDGNAVSLWNYCPNCGRRVVQ